ncbi:MAG: TrkA family potassium uptake protein [Methanomicrobiaceae archaeon]|nr:TrkA family potassium uptake protein [Methanomicrobiaceae archaeon]
MRIIIAGASPLGVDLATNLIAQGHEIIIIERNAEKAQELAECMDCTVINAEATRPEILEKAELEEAQAVIACTGHDQDNILIGLIARTANVPEIIIKTDSVELMTVAKKLGFRHVVNPSRTTSVIIADTLRGLDVIELSTLVRGEVRFTSLIVAKKSAGEHLLDLVLPPKTAAIGLYRGSELILYSENPVLQAGDELLFATNTEAEDKIRMMLSEDEEAQMQDVSPNSIRL